MASGLKAPKNSELSRIELSNILDMALSFTAMFRLYEEKSKTVLHTKLLSDLDEIFISQSIDEFERHHESFCNYGTQNIILTKKKIKASYGQIAKTLDVVLKVVIYYCKRPDLDTAMRLSQWLHAAIDNKMMIFLKRQRPEALSTWPTSIGAVDKRTYKKLQELVKEFNDENHPEFLPVNFDDYYWHKLNRTLQQPTDPGIKEESCTRGGPNKRIIFKWWINANHRTLMIHTENDRQHEFPVDEILEILRRTRAEFGNSYFPLANNVKKLGNGTEARGLGTIILDISPRDITHAQAASYLGPIMEEIRYFEWNEKKQGYHVANERPQH